MDKNIMISVTYKRIPHEELNDMKVVVDAADRKELYEAEMVVTSVMRAAEQTLSQIGKKAVPLEEVLWDTHKLLKIYPDAGVTMLRVPTRPIEFGKREPRGFELDNKMRNLIRDDLEKAKELFAPIERTVQVRKEQ